MPRQSGEGFEFVNDIVGGAIPREYIKSVEEGIREAMTTGILAGYPVDDLSVSLYDGSFHNVDSSEVAFKIAGSMAFRDAAKRAGPILLEPVMRVEIVVPEEYMGEVMGDMNGRRGRVRSMGRAAVRNRDRVRAAVGNVGYATDLRSRSQGRPRFLCISINTSRPRSE